MCIRQLIIALVLLIGVDLSAQRKLALEPDNWAIELSKGGLTEINSMGNLNILLTQVDTTRAFGFLDSVEHSVNAKGHFFITHFNMVKATYLDDVLVGKEKFTNRTSAKVQHVKNQLMKLYADAVEASYHTDDDRTIGWVSFYSSRVLRNYGETGWAVMYSKSGVDLFERAKYNVEPPVYAGLAELLYQVREYDECLIYAKKSIEAWKTVADIKDYQRPYQHKAKALNLAGRTLYEKAQYETALNYFQQALALVTSNRDTTWTGIVQGNIGRVFFQQQQFDTAFHLFETDYTASKAGANYSHTANAAQWMAKADLARGNNSNALLKLREAMQLLAKWPNDATLRDCYKTLSEVFRKANQYDSAFHYNERYNQLNDSLEKEIATSSLTISKAKLSNEQSRFNFQKLKREKETELLWRNFIIIGIIIAAVIALLVVNRRLLKQKMKTEKTEQEKKSIEQEKRLMEQEINSARDQLKMFTAHIIEKTNLIEKLESQIAGKEATSEQHALVAELSQHTILTEEDWNKFKALFEKVYPGFFIKLLDRFPETTAAEQRMSALIRLRLTTKQMAAMLGISVDSVHKSRQRLRVRFQLDPRANLEEMLASF